MNPAAIRAIGEAAQALAKIAFAALETTEEPSTLIALAEAAKRANVSARTLRDAIRGGELAAYGRQRNRAVRAADLAAWVEGRRVRPVEGPFDAGIERRMQQLAAARRKGRAR